MQHPKHDEVKEFVAEKSSPFVTTEDVSEEFPNVTARTIRKRLNALVDREEIEKRQIGRSSVVWYIQD